MGFGAFADEPLAAGEDVGERLEEQLQFSRGGRRRDLHRNGSAGELHVDGDGARRAIHGRFPRLDRARASEPIFSGKWATALTSSSSF